jgi:hypothetical protein
MNFIRQNVMAGAVCAVAIVLALVSSTPASATGAPFKHPGAIALDHEGHLWVANQDYFGITEIQASTGTFIRRIDARADGFIDPSGIAVSGNDVWVVSGGVEYENGSSHVGMVTELNAVNGDVIRTVNLKNHEMTGLSAVSADAKHVWVAADGGEKVAELSAATGHIVHIYRGGQKIVETSGIASDGGHVWIPSPEIGEGVVERNALTGKKMRTITPMHREAPPGGGSKAPVYLSPQYVSADAHYTWTGNEGGLTAKLYGGSVTQIDAATGKIVRMIGTPAYHFFGHISAIDSDGTHVWVVNGTVGTRNGQRGDTVTELSATNGALIRVVRLHDSLYSDPVGVVSNGVDVWITDTGGGATGIGSVIELDASTGAVVRVINHCCSGQ